jgi:hypothetical protein
MPFSRRVFCLRPNYVDTKQTRPSKQTMAEPDLRQTAPVVEPAAIKITHGEATVSSLRGAKRRSNPGSAAPRLDCFAPLAMTKRKAERRQTLCNNLRALRRGTAPKRGRLACRRSTTALAAATERHRSASATRLPGTWSERASRWFERCTLRNARPDHARPTCHRGRYPRLPVPVQRDCTRGPVMMPAGRVLPKPPGSTGDEPMPAGTAPAPPPGGPPDGVLVRERDWAYVTKQRTFVKDKIALSVTIRPSATGRVRAPDLCGPGSPTGRKQGADRSIHPLAVSMWDADARSFGARRISIQGSSGAPPSKVCFRSDVDIRPGGNAAEPVENDPQRT